jgi:hypothetical protein
MSIAFLVILRVRPKNRNWEKIWNNTSYPKPISRPVYLFRCNDYNRWNMPKRAARSSITGKTARTARGFGCGDRAHASAANFNRDYR